MIKIAFITGLIIGAILGVALVIVAIIIMFRFTKDTESHYKDIQD